jgi:hypothetical protein
VRRHVPLYVGICARPYCGLDRQSEEKQRECGAFPPSLGARPALGLPRSPPVNLHRRDAKWREGGDCQVDPQVGRAITALPLICRPAPHPS